MPFFTQEKALAPLIIAVAAGVGGGILFGIVKLAETLRVRKSVIVQDSRPISNFKQLMKRKESDPVLDMSPW